MIRKFTHYVLLSTLWFSVVSCEDDEIASPPKPSFQADKTSAQVGEAITFTINQVNADAVSLLPYGLPGGDAGVPVTFTEGAATVSFSYGKPGTFQAIVVANNHSSDGEAIENVQSEPITITITSNKNSISDFRFIRINETETAFEVVTISTETDIDEDANEITVTVPYGTAVNNLTAAFTASPFATVKVGSVDQTSEETANDFTNPVTYTVTANDGTATTYTVTASVTPAETLTTIKSITPVAVSKSADEKELAVSIDNTNRIIVVYDTLGNTAAQFDSVRIGYELDGKFAVLKYGDTEMDQDSLLDLRTSKEFDVESQSEVVQTYTVYAVDAPKLALSFPGLVPDPADGVKPNGFNIAISVLEGTDVTSIATVASTTDPAGVTVTGIKADGVTLVANSGVVDYSEPVEFQLTVNDPDVGTPYTVVYTVTVTVVP